MKFDRQLTKETFQKRRREEAKENPPSDLKKIQPASCKDKPAMTEQYKKRAESMLKREITNYEIEAESDFDSKRSDPIESGVDVSEERTGYLFWARSNVVKSALAAHEHMIVLIKKKYYKEIQYSKEDKYVLNESPLWMMEDKGIVKRLKRFSYTVPILNYLFNYNRYTRGEDLKKMFALTKEVTGVKKHGKYEYATFITDAEFYEKMIKKIGCSLNYLQKCLITFTEIGIIKKLGNVGRNGTLYADGYYTPYNETFRKHTFLKKDRRFVLALREFDPLARRDVQNRLIKSLPEAKDNVDRITKREIIRAVELLNDSGLISSYIETDHVSLSDLKKALLRACHSIPPDLEEDIPQEVVDVCNKLVDCRD